LRDGGAKLAGHGGFSCGVHREIVIASEAKQSRAEASNPE